MAGSSFVFGDTLIKNVFAFQVISVLWARTRVSVEGGVKHRMKMYVLEINQSIYQFDREKRT